MADELVVPFRFTGLEQAMQRAQSQFAQFAQSLAKYSTPTGSLTRHGGVSPAAFFTKYQQAMTEDLLNVLLQQGVTKGRVKVKLPEALSTSPVTMHPITGEAIPPIKMEGGMVIGIDVEKELKNLARLQQRAMDDEVTRRENIQKYLDRYNKRMEGIRTKGIKDERSAYENVEKYSERYNKRLGAIKDAGMKEDIKRNELIDTLETRFYSRVKTYRHRREQEELNARRTERMLMRERQRNYSQATMGLASAAIGLFGTAGFPMLNIAFASMSGMKYAGVAAVATAIGETTRGLRSLAQTAIKTSESLQLMSWGYKKAKAESEMATAIFGTMMQGPMEKMNREWARFAKTEAGYKAARVYGKATTEWMDPRSWIMSIIEHPIRSLWRQTGPGMLLSAPGRARELRGYVTETSKDRADTLKRMIDAREEMIKERWQYKATWVGPEEMYKKIQAAAASRVPDEDKLFRAQLKSLDEAVEYLKNIDKNTKPDTSGIITPSGRAHGFFSYQ